MFLVLASPPAATTFHNSIISPSLAVGLGAERRILAQLQLLLRGTENGTRSKDKKKLKKKKKKHSYTKNIEQLYC